MFKEVFVIYFLLFSFIYCGWIPQYSGTTANLNDVFFFNDTLTGYICGDSGIILKTTNSGNDWVKQNTPVTTKLNAIYFIGDTGWCVGNSGTMIMTTDGGLNWEGASGSEINFYDVWFINHYEGLVIGESGTTLKTTDGGRTWFFIGTPTAATLRSLFFITNSVGWIVGDNSTCLKTIYGGNIWELISIQPSGIFWDIYFINEFIGYITCDQGNVQKTTDAGEVWELFTVAPVTINLHSIDFEDSETGYICGDSGFVCKLYGQYTIINSSINLYSINFPVPKVGWTVGSNGSIYKTSDGGAIMEDVNKKVSNSLFIIPNPFTDYLIVKIPSNDRTTRLKIYNVLGKVIINKESKNGLLKLNCKTFSKGVYFIKVKNTITQVIKI